MKVRERCMETAQFEISAAPATLGPGDCGLYEDVQTRGCAPETAQSIRKSRDHSTQDPSEKKRATEAGVERNEGSVRSQRGWIAKAVAIRRGKVHGSLNGELC
jgi:hypothetical protein